VYEPPITHVKNRHVFDPAVVAEAVAPVDLILSLNPWHDNLIDDLLVRLAPSRSVGYYNAFDFHIPTDLDKHYIDLAFDLPRHLDDSLKVEAFAGPPEFLQQYDEAVDLLRSVIPQGQRILAVHAETKPDKMWPAERFSCVLDWLLDRDRNLVVLEVGLSDVGIRYGQHSARVLRCHNLQLPLAMALVGTADFFIGVDSCMLHAADMFRVPGVGLFGASDPRRFGFRFSRHRHVYGNGEMGSINVASVIEAVASLEEELIRGEQRVAEV